MSRIFRPYKSFPTQKYYKTLPEKEWFGQPNGVATLDENGKLVPSQIPGGGITPGGDSHNKGWFVNPSALPTTGENGDYAIVGSTDTIWVWDSDTSKWVNSGSTAGAVTKVNGKTGDVVLTATDISVDKSIGLVSDTVQGAFAEVLQLTSTNASNINLKQDTYNLVTSWSSKVSNTKYPSEKLVYDSLLQTDQRVTGIENDTNTLYTSKQDKLTAGTGINISDDNIISATGGTIGTVTSVNNQTPNESGNVELTIDNIPELSSKLDLKQDKTDNNLNTTDKTIVGAINEIFNKDNILSDTYKTEISTGSTTGFLLMPNGDNYVKPELNQFVDYKIKIFAKSVDNTKFEKYSVNFFAINNNDTLTITSSPTCESVSIYGGSLINNVDVTSDTKDSTKIQFYVTTTSDNVVLYTSLNKTIINNII